MNRRLIVRAEDYSMCDSVNRAIEAWPEAGTVRTSYIMTNIPVYRGAAQLSDRFPDMSAPIRP